VIQRRAAVGLVLAASTFALGACGFQAPDVTQHERSEVQGTSLSIGGVQVRAVFVTPVETSETATPLYVSVTFVNDTKTADTLVSAASPLGAVTLGGDGLTGGTLTLPPGVPVQVVDPALLTPGPTMTVGVKSLPAVGGYVPITFTFATAGTTATIQAPVLSAGETEDPTTTLSGSPATPPPAQGDDAND
jgi:copper(I)-binding protein